MAQTGHLHGRSILVVEDEALVAMMIEDLLLDFGAAVVGPAATLTEALELARTATPLHAAVLDLNIAGASSVSVAEVLASRGVPFAFASGYGEGGLPPALEDRPMLSKPFSQESLIRILRRLTDEAPP